MKPIHLGRKETVMTPLEPVKAPSGAKTVKQPIHYPSVHLHGDGKQFEDLHKLPESGVMHVKYHVHGRSSTKSEDGKNVHHSVELKIHKIMGAEADKAEPSGEEALDKLAKAMKPLPESSDPGDE